MGAVGVGASLSFAVMDVPAIRPPERGAGGRVPFVEYGLL